jgi:hypothetical protein
LPRREWIIRVDDMIAAIDKILGYTAEMDKAAFTTDERTMDAVVRNLIVIGEAAGHVPEDVVTSTCSGTRSRATCPRCCLHFGSYSTPEAVRVGPRRRQEREQGRGDRAGM